MAIKNLYLGIDVGSVSTNLVVMGSNNKVEEKLYLRTEGRPMTALCEGLKAISGKVESKNIRGVGATGSGRRLAGVITGADIVKNEITTHAVAALEMVDGVRTILEIGGQDSKIIILRNGVVTDFAMNTVCAAGTGSFLDRQASRLNLPICELGKMALKSAAPVRIAGRCAVFAESDMIHKQQAGHKTEDIIAGLCQAMVRNYLNNLAKGKKIEGPVVFQGGVAANEGIAEAFRNALQQEIIIPEYYDVMGAYGASLLAKKRTEETGEPGCFKGFEIAHREYSTNSFECSGCSNCCEIIEVMSDNNRIARWGGRCGKWV